MVAGACNLEKHARSHPNLVRENALLYKTLRLTRTLLGRRIAVLYRDPDTLPVDRENGSTDIRDLLIVFFPLQARHSPNSRRQPQKSARPGKNASVVLLSELLGSILESLRFLDGVSHFQGVQRAWNARTRRQQLPDYERAELQGPQL